MMSRRTRRDYKKVLKKVKKMLPSKGENITTAVLDFEIAMCQAIREVLPEVRIQGCVFHWTQAVWRHCQGLGLQAAYTQDEDIQSYIKKLLALPFLPACGAHRSSLLKTN